MCLAAMPLALGIPNKLVLLSAGDSALMLGVAATNFVAQLLSTRGLQIVVAAKAAAMGFTQVCASVFAPHLRVGSCDAFGRLNARCKQNSSQSTCVQRHAPNAHASCCCCAVLAACHDGRTATRCRILLCLLLVQVFYSYLLGAIFFGDRMTLLGLFGVALILVGVLMVTMRPPKGTTSRPAAADKQTAAAVAAQPTETQLGASRTASLAAAGVAYAGAPRGQRQTASLTPTLSRTATAKAALKAQDGLDTAIEQPLLQHIQDLQQGAESIAADAAVVIKATGSLVSLAQIETAAAAATAAVLADGDSKQIDDGGAAGTAKPGMLSAFVQAALQSAVWEADAGSADDGEGLTRSATLVVLFMTKLSRPSVMWGIIS
jgi:hypothetical protein